MLGHRLGTGMMVVLGRSMDSGFALAFWKQTGLRQIVALPSGAR